MGRGARRRYSRRRRGGGSVTAEARLRAALDAAACPVALWWRDDDAGRDHHRLGDLLDLAERHAAPVALAVVPAWLEEPCRHRILASPWASVVQHGVAHTNHAPAGQKKVELGGEIDLGVVADLLAQRRARLEKAFGARFRPILVPPWNRIDPRLVARLPALGFAGLSVFGPAAQVAAPAPLRVVNTHLDLVAWRDGARALALDEVAEALARLVAAGSAEPIGLLTHHLAMDGGAFATLDRLLALVQDHARARLVAAPDLFGGQA
jgi:hypothetical protein